MWAALSLLCRHRKDKHLLPEEIQLISSHKDIPHLPKRAAKKKRVNEKWTCYLEAGQLAAKKKTWKHQIVFCVNEETKTNTENYSTFIP